MPRQIGVDEFIAERSADVLLITPLIELGSPQLDYVRAARALGIRSALCVWSWDHLSSKALIRVVPDTRASSGTRRSATRPSASTASRPSAWSSPARSASTSGSTGAPTRDRDDFCRRVGFAGDASVSCSTSARRCSGAARRRRRSCRDGWRRSGSRATPRLREMPHSGAAASAAARGVDGRRAGRAGARRTWCVWGSNPVDADSRADYFDSMYHAAAVVGLNTSALVEAAIVDRPVFTILCPSFATTRKARSTSTTCSTSATAFSTSSRSLDEHVAQLAGLLSGGSGPRRTVAFVEHFIRPRGAAVAATPVFVEAVETIAREPSPRPQLPPAWRAPAAAP